MDRNARFEARTKTVLCLAGILVFALGIRPDRAAAQAPLRDLAGKPAVVEFPDLEHFGERIRVPSGWGYLQASADTILPLQQRLGVDQIPAIVLLDAHGNVLWRDQKPGARGRLRASISRFDKKRKELVERIDRLWNEATDARAAGKDAREVSRVTQLVALGVRGYEEVEQAKVRLEEIDRDRWLRLLEILAGEGLVTPARLLSDLKKLGQISADLPVARTIQRQRARLERGISVDPPS